MFKPTNNLWLISDTHFGHHNIIKFNQRPITHEIIMVSNWIDRVGEDDRILHMGDVTMKNKGTGKRWMKVVSRLPGQKFLIKGNHDFADNKIYEDVGFTVIDPFIYKGVAFTHRPISEAFNIEGEWDVNIHGHTHTNDYSPDHDGIMFDKTYINICVEHTNLAPVQLGGIYPIK